MKNKMIKRQGKYDEFSDVKCRSPEHPGKLV